MGVIYKMPGFKKSQSQKRSQSQSKNGGRRRKHTMRKLRRMKKSRKVMRGGATNYPVVINDVSPLPIELITKLKDCKISGNVEDRVYAIPDNLIEQIYNSLIPEGFRTDTKPDEMREAIIKHVVVKTTTVLQQYMNSKDIPVYLRKTKDDPLADAERGANIEEYNKNRLLS